MILTADKFFVGNPVNVPVCIVGAGAVGLSMAIKLIRQGKPVLLLEADARSYPPKTQQSPVNNDGDCHTFVEGSYNTGLGGSTLSWGGQILPFDDFDFETRKGVPNSGWPLEYEDLEAWYAQASELLGVDYISFEESVHPDSLEHPEESSGLQLGFSKWCPESDFTKLFASEIRDSELLRIVLGACVSSISRDAMGDGFELRLATEKNQQLTLMVSTLVVAGGGLESYKLLANSPEISSQLPALGHYYHDHIGFYGARLKPINLKRFNHLFATKLAKGERCVPKIMLNSSYLRKHDGLNVNGTIEARAKNGGALEHLKALRQIIRGKQSLRSLPMRLLGVMSNLPTAVKTSYQYLVHNQVTLPENAEFFLIASCESVPCHASKISLGESAGDEPIATWLVDDSSRDAMRRFYLSVKKYLEEHEIAEVHLKPDLFANDRGWVGGVYSLYHHMGATRMGASVEQSVVDQNCQVHGQPGLYIAGCSVLPTGSCSNPTFTAIALGLRLVEVIAKKYET